ncbi:MAG: sugar transferase, partial [Treponema sp.]|nr:sugar transferase [Treponema sp.]
MLRNSPNMAGGVLTQKDDPRILPMGKFLRKTKINELPQLANIFIGQMSIIGPRPQAKAHYDLYSEEVKAAIDAVPPGLSGIGSVVFRDEEDMLNAVSDRAQFYADVVAPYKGALEVWFASHRTLAVYFKLIWLTVLAVLRPSSKAWRTAFKDLPPVPEALERYM